MSVSYDQLLAATIQHLEELKSRGARFVTVSPETLAALSTPAGPSPQPASPTQARAVPTQAAPAPVRVSPIQVQPATVPSTRQDLLPTSPAASGPPMSREARETAMADLRARAMVCEKCANLAAARKNVVFGVGDIHSPLLFVGEAPGADEDEQGEPFVGKAGQLLTRIIQTMGFTRETVYIANILKCRPDTPGQATGNRKPTTEEMKTCLPYLLAQIEIIRPTVIVALGATAVEGLLGLKGGITRLRGHWQEFAGVPVMPTFHPAYLLRNETLAEKRKVWEDMLQVLEKLGRPISDRQRSFFLKA